MLPTQTDSLLEMDDDDVAYEDEDYPSYTYALDFEGNPSAGMIDSQEAIAQSLLMRLMTEQGEYDWLSLDYGSNLNEMMANGTTDHEISYHIEQVLLQDDRVESVDDLEIYSIEGDYILHATVSTTEGYVELDENLTGGEY